MKKQKTDKLNGEYGLVRMSTRVKRSIYKQAIESMEILGINNESTYLSMALSRFNQHILDKNKKPSSEENGFLI